MRIIIFFCLFSYSLGAAELPSTSTYSADILCRKKVNNLSLNNDFAMSVRAPEAGVDNATAFLLATESPTDISAIAKEICTSFDISTYQGLLSLDSATADIKKKICRDDKSAFDDWHTIIFNLMRHAQKRQYPLDMVTSITTVLGAQRIKTGWRYSVLTNEKTELHPLRQRIICFGMSINMNDASHCQKQFIVAPLQTQVNGNQLINNI